MKQPKFDECNTCLNLPYLHGAFGPCSSCVAAGHYKPGPEPEETRIDVIGQNGNDGDHYRADS